MTPYLQAQPNPHGDHFYATRVRPILAITVHITAGLEDLDGVDDHSAEKTARYAATTDRSVSWHSGSDTDSSLELLPATYTAFHVRGYNSSTYGHEISKRDPNWDRMSKRWRDATLTQAARHLAHIVADHDIPVRKATKAELDAAIADYDRTGVAKPVGFVSHWELDPTRRSDPGLDRASGRDTFPWGEFLALVAVHVPKPATDRPPSEEDDMGDHAIRVLTAYRQAGRDPERASEAAGVDYWLKQLRIDKNGPDAVVEYLRLFALELPAA